jgi:hypothetical protein
MFEYLMDRIDTLNKTIQELVTQAIYSILNFLPNKEFL